MCRRISPPAETNLLSSPPPLLPLSFFAVGILASLAILAALCASCYPKPSQPPPSSSPKNQTEETMVPPTAESIQPDNPNRQDVGELASSSPQEEDEKKTELEAEIHGPIYGSAVPAISKSKRRLSISLSMGLQEGLSRIMTSRRERQKEEEDTLWKKTIIMGEKNRAPDEEQGGDGGDLEAAAAAAAPATMVGSFRRNYRPRSLSVSRNSSFVAVGFVGQ